MLPYPIRTLMVAVLLTCTFAAAQNHDAAPSKFNEATIAQLQADMAAGKLTSVELTEFYLTRIFLLDQKGPGVNSVIQLNPDALALARNADVMRRHGASGPLLGIPVLLKDNIDTGDKMQTTAGSFGLFGIPALQDSTVAANLRNAGAVILGKTNLSEWANFRSFFRPAAGRDVAAWPTIPTLSTAMPVGPVRDRGRPRQQTSRQSRSVAKPTVALFVQQMSTG